MGHHEVGTVQPVAEVVARLPRAVPPMCWSMWDAAAAGGGSSMNFGDRRRSDVDQRHKFGGPPGIGALLVAPGTGLVPLLEAVTRTARRAGVENGAAIAGFAAASRA